GRDRRPRPPGPGPPRHHSPSPPTPRVRRRSMRRGPVVEATAHSCRGLAGPGRRGYGRPTVDEEGPYGRATMGTAPGGQRGGPRRRVAGADARDVPLEG